MVPSTEKQFEKTGARHLCAKHYQELAERRGLDASWSEVNCRSVSPQEATQRLGYLEESHSTSPSHWVSVVAVLDDKREVA